MAKKPTRTQELFKEAFNFNWDDGYKELYEIATDPDCDKGTALFMYWNSRPEWFTRYNSELEVPFYEKDNYAFVKFMEEKLINGFYTKEEIIYDPGEDGQINMYKNDFVVKIPLSEEVYKKTGGIIHFKEV